MKIIVAYESHTGFTMQYGRWIAEELQCCALPAKSVDASVVDEADLVVFGGWVLGDHIKGLARMKKLCKDKLMVYAVGAMPQEENVRLKLIRVNGLENTPFFYYQGGFRMSRLSGFERMMLRMVANASAKKKDKSEEDELKAGTIGKDFDGTDRSAIGNLVACARNRVGR